MTSNTYAQIPIPKYYQVYLALKEKIQEGMYASETPIPSERQLVELFDVSRITIVKAIDLLVQDGLIERHQGLGNYVCKPVKSNPPKFRNIALVIPGTLEGYIASVLTGMMQEASANATQIQLIHPQTGSKNSLFFNELCCGDLDGVILYPGEKGWETWVKAIIESGVPVVLIDRYFPQIACDHVVFNDEETSYQLVKMMFEEGLRRIAFIPGTEVNTTSVINRMKGFQRAHLECGVPIDEDLMWLEVYNHFKTGVDRMQDDTIQTLDRHIRTYAPDGIFAVNHLVGEKFYFNLMTLQNHQMLADLNPENSIKESHVSYRIGQSGICDHDVYFHNPYYQRMAYQNGYQMGIEAFQLLLARILGTITTREPIQKVIPMQFF